MVMHEGLHGRWIKALYLTVELFIVLRQKMLDQQGDIALALAQWWDLNRDDIEPVIQIFAKGTRFGHIKQIFIGRRDNAHVNADRLGAANALKLPLLQDA